MFVCSCDYIMLVLARVEVVAVVPLHCPRVLFPIFSSFFLWIPNVAGGKDCGGGIAR